MQLSTGADFCGAGLFFGRKVARTRRSLLDRVVIIDPAFLGDVVFNGPLVRALLQNGAKEVGMVVRPPADQLARRILGVKRVHIFDKRGRDSGARGLLRMAATLSAEGYQTALIPHPSPRSALLGLLARIPRRVGSLAGPVGRLFLTDFVDGRKKRFVEQRLCLFRDGQFSSSLAGTLKTESRDRRAAKKSRIGLILGAHYATKRWSPIQARNLVQTLIPELETLLLVGTREERELYAQVVKAAQEKGVEFLDRCGVGIGEMIDDLSQCDVVVGGDTGPVHIARALGVPVIALFGPTSEQQHLFAPSDSVLKTNIECSPCSSHGDDYCPQGHHRCMGELESSMVRRALKVLEAS